jgi:2-methylisocitrate lyase-like PEP mutase family enzyme
MPSQAQKADTFLSLHHGSGPLLMPNPFDLGSARMLESLGFSALATTSGGFAASLGLLDGSVTREEAVDHAAAVVGAVEVPVSADLENCFADEPEGVAATIEMAIGAGLAGCSVEDFSGDPDAPIYELALARDRVAAAAEVAHAGPVHLVLTARAENMLRGIDDLADAIARLQAYQDAGADVLFAPGFVTPEDVGRIVASIDRPLNVLVRPGAPPIAELTELGVARVSVGSWFAWAAYTGVVESAQELLGPGTYGFAERSAPGRAVGQAALKRR